MQYTYPVVRISGENINQDTYVCLYYAKKLDMAYLPIFRWPDESQRDIVGAPLVKWLQKSSQAMPNCQEDDNADIPYIFAILFLLLMKKWIVYYNDSSSVALVAIIIS